MLIGHHQEWKTLYWIRLYRIVNGTRKRSMKVALAHFLFCVFFVWCVVPFFIAFDWQVGRKLFTTNVCERISNESLKQRR